MPEIRAFTTSDRVLILGTTGAGKSELEKAVLAATDAEHWLAIDQKRSFTPFGKRGKDWWLVGTPTGFLWRYPRIVFRPKPGYNNGSTMAFVLRRTYEKQVQTPKDKRQKSFIYVDEALKLTKDSKTAANELANIFVTGREIQLGVHIASQRPRYIPIECRSEANIIVTYTLGYEEDEVEVSKLLKGKVTVRELQSLEPYWFYMAIKKPGGQFEVAKYPPITIGEEKVSS